MSEDNRATPIVVHTDDSRWQGIEGHAHTVWEPEERWPQYGMSVDVLEPGRSNAPYHREDHEDETFLVLDGEFAAVVDGEPLRLGAGDLVHCPAGTAHAFVCRGERPGAILMLGARGRAPEGGPWGEYVANPHAAALGASVTETTADSEVAYAGVPDYAPVAAPWSWRLDRSPRPEGGLHALHRGDNGWFAVHLDDIPWVDNGPVARGRIDHLFHFDQYGMNIQVMQPGQPNCRYHREHRDDETMLVLGGEAIAIIEGEEHPVRAGHLVHCPAGTAHVFVGAGDRPSAVLMVGNRDPRWSEGPEWGTYVADPVAARHGAAVEEDTNDPEVAYATRPPFEPTDTPPWRFGAA
ncbi:MAG: cupin protein [Thermoleophilia bacterium]|nr:cupin protein [Thermoleophilia bacterium]